MARSLFRAPWYVASSATLLAVLVIPSVARADIAPNVCEVEHFKRYLGEVCVACDASAREPDACRDKHAPEGMVQRCYNWRGESSWTEIWCHLGGKDPNAAAAPAPDAKLAPAEPPAPDAKLAPAEPSAPATPQPAPAASSSGCNLASGPSSPQ